ncbi:MAG TPA: DoxX family protein [Stellaceae bacterium]|nr:DoxX family protein [Stellaceae bacterium]
MTDDGDGIAGYGALLLRLALGIMFLAHSIIVKLLNFTLAGTNGYFVKLGLPSNFAYLVFAMEAVGGAMLILGLFTRTVSLILAPILLGAIYFVHWQNGWGFANTGGGWEFPAFWFVACLVQALIGSGPLALTRSR